MTTSELLKRLNEANFSFTKPYSKEEIEYSNEQKKSMNKLIVCRLAKEISTNKFVLTDDGKKANILGVEKWAKSLSDVERRNFIYDSFELKKNWYNLPITKDITVKQLSSKISNLSLKAVGTFVTVIFSPLLVITVWERYKTEILNIWHIFFD